MQEIQTRNHYKGRNPKGMKILCFVLRDAESFSRNKLEYPQQMGTGWLHFNRES